VTFAQPAVADNSVCGLVFGATYLYCVRKYYRFGRSAVLRSSVTDCVVLSTNHIVVCVLWRSVANEHGIYFTQRGIAYSYWRMTNAHKSDEKEV